MYHTLNHLESYVITLPVTPTVFQSTVRRKLKRVSVSYKYSARVVVGSGPVVTQSGGDCFVSLLSLRASSFTDHPRMTH